MPGFISDSPLAGDLIRIGDEAIARADEVALRAYFTEDYVFHGPGGDLNFDQLSAYFASLRDALPHVHHQDPQHAGRHRSWAATWSRTRAPIHSLTWGCPATGRS